VVQLRLLLLLLLLLLEPWVSNISLSSQRTKRCMPRASVLARARELD
jgi:hypothetical protein